MSDTINIKEEIKTHSGGKNKKKRWYRKYRKPIIRSLCAAAVVLVLYLIAAFSSIPFIAKWRTLYIETAMSTHSHQWLAEWFLPMSQIEAVVAEKESDLAQQEGLISSWGEDTASGDGKDGLFSGNNEESFYEEYWELDSPSFHEYLESRSYLVEEGFDNLLIEDLDNELELYTTNGDALLVVDVANNLLIIGVEGDGYVGKMAIVKNPAQVDLVKSKSLGDYGELAESYGERCDALLVINASGFKDPEGHGAGGEIKGCLVIDGEEYGKPMGDTWKLFGFKNDNRLYIANYYEEDISEYRWAVEFFPALIVNGEISITGSFGMGIQPRTTIGQTEDGDFLMLIVDGRQVGYSLGCTVADCAEIMLSYGAYQGANMDGGSSSVMWYKGQQITKSSSKAGNGRYMPDALIVRRPDDPEVGTADTQEEDAADVAETVGATLLAP
jgi:exopolysaccharide biosynthesis protein